MIEFPPFRLDTANQCLWRRSADGSDLRVLLPPKAFALLRYLAEHPGRLVTEDELLKAVWPKVYVQPEAIKSQLYEIRKVLGDHPKMPRYIETLPRRGYQFIAAVLEAPSADPLAAARPISRRVVGRERTFSELRDRLRAASGSQRQVVLITGESGIGKTTVVDEFQRQTTCDFPSVRIARGQCIDAFGGTEAYYPILDALDQLCRGSSAASTIEILAAQAPTWLVQFPALLTQRHRELLRQELLGATRERMVREICTALETLTADTPLLLVLEDVQWVDHSTVDVISALARRRETAKLILVATSRPIDMLDSDHAFKALRQNLMLRQLCHEIELAPLTEAEVAKYLAADSSQAGPPKGLTELIQRHTEGNPLFMVAALDHLTERGFISRENGSWQLRMPLEEIDLGVPESLRQMIDAQIERLSTEEQRALEAASVEGPVFSVSVSASPLADKNAEDLEILYETLARRCRMVRSIGIQRVPDGSTVARYEFVHALYREVLYRRQPSLRRSRLHRRIGERLERLYSQQASDVGAELAYHFEQSSDWPRAVRYLQLAADTAIRRFAPREAAAHLEHALVVASKLPEAERGVSETGILEKLAMIYLMSYDTRALKTYEALAAKAAHYGILDAQVRAIIQAAIPLSWIDSQRCLEALDRAVRLNAQQVEPVARASACLQCSYWRIWAGGWNEVDAGTCRTALSEMREGADRIVLAPVLIDYSNVLYMGSEYRESQRVAQEGLEALTVSSIDSPAAPLTQVTAKYVMFCDHLFLGEWGEAVREIEALIAALTRNTNDIFADGMRFWRAWLGTFAMDFVGALAICESAARSLGDAISAPDRRFYLTVAGTAEAGLGNHARALEHLSLARGEMDRQTVLGDWCCRFPLESALTELWLVKGDLTQARAHAKRFLELTLATGERTWKALAWEANTRVAMAEGDLERAQDFIETALSTVDAFELPLAHWRAHATAADLAELRGHAESARQHRALSRATILELATSLAADEPLRRSFLSAAPVVRILGNLGSG